MVQPIIEQHQSTSSTRCHRFEVQKLVPRILNEYIWHPVHLHHIEIDLDIRHLLEVSLEILHLAIPDEIIFDRLTPLYDADVGVILKGSEIDHTRHE